MTGPTPAVSVVMPTYQRHELVQRAVASVLAQTFTDFELIVVDDGSTDGTGEALKDGDPRLRYVWQENAGVAAARNHAVKLARAPLIAFLDSDDRWLPDHLEVLTEVMARHPKAVLATTCPNFAISGSETAADAVLRNPRGHLPAYARLGGFPSCAGVRREAIERARGFDERIRAYEDTDLWVRLGIQGPFATVQRKTIVCQTTPGSLRHRSRPTGEYLAGAELSAANVLETVMSLPEAEREGLIDQAHGAIHLSRAMRALDRDQDDLLRAELAEAIRYIPLSRRPGQVESRIRGHLTRGHDPDALLAALWKTAELWPEAGSDTARYLRLHAIFIATQLGRPSTVFRLVRGWPAGDTRAFLRRVEPMLRQRFRRWRQDRRLRARGSVELGTTASPPPAPIRP